MILLWLHGFMGVVIEASCEEKNKIMPVLQQLVTVALNN
jgi:hypothetical protein